MKRTVQNGYGARHKRLCAQYERAVATGTVAGGARCHQLILV